MYRETEPPYIRFFLSIEERTAFENDSAGVGKRLVDGQGTPTPEGGTCITIYQPNHTALILTKALKEVAGRLNIPIEDRPPTASST